MMISRGYNVGLLITSLLAIGAYTTAAGLPLLALAVLSGFTLGWHLSSRRKGRLLFPRGIVNLLLGAAVAYVVLISIRRVEIESIAQLVMFMMLIKLGDRRGPRDDGQLLSLSVFLAIAAMLDSNALGVGLQLTLLLPVLVGTIMLFQIESGRNGEGPWRQEGQRDRGVLVQPPAPGVWKRVAVVTLLATLHTLLAAGIVFIMMPRGLGESVLGRWNTRRDASVTGFTSVVKLGQGRVISTSPVPVLDYTIKDESGINLGGPNVVYYVRGLVLDSYRDGTWTVGAEGPIRTLPVPPGAIGPRDGQLVVQHVSVRTRVGAGNRTPIFSIWRPVSIIMQGDPEPRVRMGAETVDVRTRPPFTYVLEAAIVESRPGELVRTEVSFNSPQIRRLAVDILSRARISPDPALRPVEEDVHAARAIMDFLRTGFEYTLVEPEITGQREPIEEFLFHTRRGHCEYFASAMVALCRSVGVNARMIAGYVAAEYVEGSGHYVVRQSNAHAWVEVEHGLGRWRTFDPTPPEDLARYHRPVPTLLNRMRQVLDAVEYAWTTSVVSFNERDRQRLLGAASEDSADPMGLLSQLAQRVQAGGAKLLLAATASGVIVFAGVALAGFGVMRLAEALHWLRGRVRLSAGPAREHRSLAFQAQMLEALRRRGLAKPLWRPPLEHAAAIQPQDPEAGAAARELTTLYYRARFGGQTLTTQEREAARARVRKLRQKPAPGN